MEKSDNPWRYKPWWCQPWSIVVTGITLIAGAWFLTRWIWLTILVAIPVLAWMGLFLILWPRAMQQAYAEQQPFEDESS
ncbi:MAG: hypothetical protein HC851_21300 [Acaryochloris sp. RU_4_1]|nr:hypothetical protein [Acaryochloris sp. RU_4_1]NJR56638.1 hypothetical protein [Acaryochloris sp. CRU_2_0]